MAIKNRELKPGIVLTGHFHKVEYNCEVVESDGKLFFRVLGDDYSSISAAGRSVTGHPCNGWIFWSEAETCPDPDHLVTIGDAEVKRKPAKVPGYSWSQNRM